MHLPAPSPSAQDILNSPESSLTKLARFPRNSSCLPRLTSFSKACWHPWASSTAPSVSSCQSGSRSWPVWQSAHWRGCQNSQNLKRERRGKLSDGSITRRGLGGHEGMPIFFARFRRRSSGSGKTHRSICSGWWRGRRRPLQI